MTLTDEPTLTEASSDRVVPTRRINFEYSLDTLPKHFADGDIISSHLIATLSAVFPDGEDFFVRSVRHYRNDITDPILKKQVKGFIAQESIHGREHRTFNDKLDALGYPTKKIERFTEKGLKMRERMLGAKSNLAATAALEHFTATLAEQILGNPEARDLIGHDEVKNMFLWHALEESEHKAVAFDVYKAVGGGERLRIFTMRIVMLTFILGLGATTALSMFLSDRSAWNPVKLAKSLWRFRKSPFLRPSLLVDLNAYNKAGFHPDDNDTSALEEEWKTKLFGDEGTLVERLAA